MMSAHRRAPRPSKPRPARLALRIPHASDSGIVDAADLRAEPLVASLAASLARSRPAPPPPLPLRADPWPMLVLCSALAAVVAFTGVAAVSRLAPHVATERARVPEGHLSIHSVSSRVPASASVRPSAPEPGAP